MKIHFMTWNTRLYEYCNILSDRKTGKKKVKSIDYGKCIDIINIVREHMRKENAVAVLQEIPLRSNVTQSEHIVWTLLQGVFPQKDYTILYNIETVAQIKMTVVIAKKGIIESDDERLNLNKRYKNCFVSFKVKNTDLHVLAVHQKNKVYAFDRFNNGKPKPNIILGDFNAGNYSMQNQDDREKYINLLNLGYKDICNGQITTIYNTPIDHILIDDKNVKRAKDLKIVPNDNLSDHHRITFELQWE